MLFSSEWAALIVPIPKGDRNIHVYGDYKVTIINNHFLVVDQHPLLKPEELFSSLSGGQKFSKIDLSHAYQQMVLEDSCKYVIINTHKGCIDIHTCLLESPLSLRCFKEQWTQCYKGFLMCCII